MGRVVSTAIVVALLMLMSPAAQAAPRLQCGALVTKSTKLTADLTCPTGVALQVETDGAAIVLDLGGHQVKSSGAEVGIRAAQRDGSGTVTVRNGSVKGFATGISLTRAPGTSVKHVTVSGPGSTTPATVGVTVSASPGYALDHVTIKGFRRGLQVQAGDGGRVRDSTLSGNGIAVALTPTVLSLTVVRSRISDNEQGFGLSQSAMTLVDSKVTRNGVGISLFQSRATIRDSRIADNGTGIYGESNDSGLQLSGSTVRDNGTGVRLVGFGLRGADNVIERNTIADNGGPGLVVDLAQNRGAPALRIAGNRFLDNGAAPVDAGIPDVSDQGAAIRVPVDAASVVVADNDARRNAGIGIDAVGASDGGGNTARSNDGALQCRGVVCGR